MEILQDQYINMCIEHLQYIKDNMEMLTPEELKEELTNNMMMLKNMNQNQQTYKQYKESLNNE